MAGIREELRTSRAAAGTAIGPAVASVGGAAIAPRAIRVCSQIAYAASPCGPVNTGQRGRFEPPHLARAVQPSRRQVQHTWLARIGGSEPHGWYATESTLPELEGV